jgi:putative peptidoglycan lipid II flippase
LILRLVISLTLPAAVGLWVLDMPLVRMLFEHGKFDPHSTQMVVFALHFYALGLISHAIVEIGVRVFYALHDTWTPVVVGVIAMAFNVLLSFALVGVLQHGGLALANSIATTLEMLSLLALLNRRVGGLQLQTLVTSLARIVIGCAIMALVTWASVRWLQGFAGLSGMVGVWLAALGGIALAVVSYGASTLLLGSIEARWLLALILRRGRSAENPT